MKSNGESAFRNLYIHIPFCSGKCSYCGFYSERFTPSKADLFLDALEIEIAAAADGLSRPAPESLYIGGGTPSLLQPAQWDRLFDLLQRFVDLTEQIEWTIEANPGTLTPELASNWRQHGVSRVSLGVQSMCDATLTRIGRRHNTAQTIATVGILKQSGFERIGLDLIAGLPEVTLDEWNETLAAVMDLAPSHVSVYACSIEPGSRLSELQQQGRHHPPSAEFMDAALDTATAILAGGGFEHYETSNYARPGQRCRHNTNVWKGADYIGFGPAAASRAGLERWTNLSSLDAYVDMLKSGGCPPRQAETLSPESDAAERLLFNFRLADPVSLDAFAKEHGPAARQLLPYWRLQLTRLATEGLVIHQGGTWSCTPQGRNLADSIAEALLP